MINLLFKMSIDYEYENDDVYYSEESIKNPIIYNLKQIEDSVDNISKIYDSIYGFNKQIFENREENNEILKHILYETELFKKNLDSDNSILNNNKNNNEDIPINETTFNDTKNMILRRLKSQDIETVESSFCSSICTRLRNDAFCEDVALELENRINILYDHVYYHGTNPYEHKYYGHLITKLNKRINHINIKDHYMNNFYKNLVIKCRDELIAIEKTINV